MNKCFTLKDILNIISSFLTCKETTTFSLVNKSLYSFLDPENNSYINSKYRDVSLKKYFNINNKKNYDINVLNLDDYQKTKNNWKNISKNLYINSLIDNSDKTKEVYNCFNVHCYMPYQRIENNVLEYEFSTMHQKFCYDIQKNNLIMKNYYNKYFENEQNHKIEPLRKGLFFEQELINLKSEIPKYKNQNITNLIMNYSFEKLDSIYRSNFVKGKNNKKNKKSKKFKSNIILFLLWLNHTFILFVNLLYNYVLQFTHDKDPKKIVTEYSKIHIDLINFGLMINEKFNNINIIFAYLKNMKNENEKSSINNNFKIYNMFLNIMEKNFYQKLKPLLDNNIQKLINLAYKENLEQEKLNNTYDSNNNETNNTEMVNEENENDDYLYDNINEIEDDENENENDEDTDNVDLTYKDIIEKYFNLILDYSINQDNCIYINSSKIKLNDYYREYENLLSENISKIYENQLIINMDEKTNCVDDEEINTLNNIFSFIKKIASKDGDYHLINRTKLNLLKNSENIIFNYLKTLINKDFIYNIKCVDKTNNNYIINKKNIVLNSLGFNNKYYNTVEYEFYLQKIDEIKNYLIENNTKNIVGDEKRKNKIEEAANNYINSNNRLMALSKDIILFYYNQIYLYNCEDVAIIEYLSKSKDNTQLKLFQ